MPLSCLYGKYVVGSSSVMCFKRDFVLIGIEEFSMVLYWGHHWFTLDAGTILTLVGVQI